jgi:ADP-ribosylation factor family
VVKLVACLVSAEEGRLDEAKAALEHALASSELFGAPLLVIANKQVTALKNLLFM